MFIINNMTFLLFGIFMSFPIGYLAGPLSKPYAIDPSNRESSMGEIPDGSAADPSSANLYPEAAILLTGSSESSEYAKAISSALKNRSPALVSENDFKREIGNQKSADTNDGTKVSTKENPTTTGISITDDREHDPVHLNTNTYPAEDNPTQSSNNRPQAQLQMDTNDNRTPVLVLPNTSASSTTASLPTKQTDPPPTESTSINTISFEVSPLYVPNNKEGEITRENPSKETQTDSRFIQPVEKANNRPPPTSVGLNNSAGNGSVSDMQMNMALENSKPKGCDLSAGLHGTWRELKNAQGFKAWLKVVAKVVTKGLQNMGHCVKKVFG